ncbi:MAG: hypothetical protein MI743_18385 [Sneathiellales bacterium]|nr:hypothetical protein [Sneathiellales bacterium]
MITQAGKRGRYEKSKILEKKINKNQLVKYFSRRFIPKRESVQATGTQTVQTGDRPDLVSYRAYSNPLLYYHLADYNLCMNPFTLTHDPGRVLIIPSNSTF